MRVVMTAHNRYSALCVYMYIIAVQLDDESVASFVDEKKAANAVRNTRT